MKVLDTHKNKVLVSDDYDLFNFGKNRISKARVQNLVDEMAIKNLSKDLPIIIDADFNILDGRYRFEANKILSRPIYYKVAEVGNFIDFMKAANLQYKPSSKDYAIVHSDKASYRKLVQFYNKLPMSFDDILKDFFDLYARSRDRYRQFKDGLFDMTIKDEYKLKESVKIAEYIHTDLSENIQIGNFNYLLHSCGYQLESLKEICRNNCEIISAYCKVVDSGFPIEDVIDGYEFYLLIEAFQYANEKYNETVISNIDRYIEPKTMYHDSNPYNFEFEGHYCYHNCRTIMQISKNIKD